MSTITPLGVSSVDSAVTLHAGLADRRTQLMSILNLTPDSFSDGGAHPRNAADSSALADAIRLHQQQGASMVDIGGQSSRPHAADVSSAEELARILPTLEAWKHFRRLHPSEEAPVISVDTYRAPVAQAALENGAEVINDVSGGLLDPAILKVAAQAGCAVILGHIRGTPATMNSLAHYPPKSHSSESPTSASSDSSFFSQRHFSTSISRSDPSFASPSLETEALISAIGTELHARVEAAMAAGIYRWRLVLDPGLGFAKQGQQNTTVLRHLARLRHRPGLQGLPWCVGASRKAFIGAVTAVTEPRARIGGTAAAVAAAIHGGADIVRVHDTEIMRQTRDMADAIWRQPQDSW